MQLFWQPNQEDQQLPAKVRGAKGGHGGLVCMRAYTNWWPVVQAGTTARPLGMTGCAAAVDTRRGHHRAQRGGAPGRLTCAAGGPRRRLALRLRAWTGFDRRLAPTADLQL